MTIISGRIRPLLLLGGAVLVGCGDTALERDITALLLQNSVAVQNLSCKMSGDGRSRDGECRATLSPEESSALVSSLHLVPAKNANETAPMGDAPYDSTVERMRIIYPAACNGMIKSLTDGTSGERAFYAFGRPQTLRLKSGTAFEYLFYIYSPEKSEACILTSYAYG